jgi:hypothetical protein
MQLMEDESAIARFSVEKIAQLFLDMAILVDSQGELLNSIEYNGTLQSLFARFS